MRAAGPTAHVSRAMPGWIRAAYGFGAVAYGVKDNGVSYFLLLFYSQGGGHALAGVTST